MECKLEPRVNEILSYMRAHGSITPQEAYLNLAQTTSAGLTTGISKMQRAGIKVRKERKTNPVTQRPYVRYYLEEENIL